MATTWQIVEITGIGPPRFSIYGPTCIHNSEPPMIAYCLQRYGQLTDTVEDATPNHRFFFGVRTVSQILEQHLMAA